MKNATVLGSAASRSGDVKQGELGDCWLLRCGRGREGYAIRALLWVWVAFAYPVGICGFTNPVEDMVFAHTGSLINKSINLSIYRSSMSVVALNDALLDKVRVCSVLQFWVP